MTSFEGRLFAGRLFAGRLFRGVRREENSGGWFDYPDRPRREGRQPDTAIEVEAPFSIAAKPGANALREFMLSRKGLTEAGRRTVAEAADEDLTLIMAMMIAMDD